MLAPYDAQPKLALDFGVRSDMSDAPLTASGCPWSWPSPRCRRARHHGSRKRRSTLSNSRIVGGATPWKSVWW